MAKRKKVGLITNICIAVVLVGLGFAVFTADLANVFISVTAPVYNGKTGRISLMFAIDETTRAADLDEVLKKLETTNTQATFFISGAWAMKGDNKEFVKEIAENYDLFELGNYAFTGKSLAKQSEKNQYIEISNCHKLIKNLTGGIDFSRLKGKVVAEETDGIEMNLFLPPHGLFDKKTLKCAQKLGYRTVMFSRNATENVLVTATENINGGEFILLKPDYTTSNNLHKILLKYDQNRLETVKISANLA